MQRAQMQTSRIGKRGVVVIPANLRKKYGLNEGDIVIAEAGSEGILIKPAVTLPVEMYSKERIAEFLLTNSINDSDYKKNIKEVRKTGIDPEKVSHKKPG
jgi:AbrB family looped-hinge helix DNA binding protein